MAAASRESGFSLMEALLALIVSAFVLSALATLIARWIPAWDRGVWRLQRVEAVAAGADRLIADLAAAEYVSSGGAPDRLLFDGGPQEATFVRTPLGPNASLGLEIVHIAPGADKGQPALLRRAAPFAILPGGFDLASLTSSPPVALLRAPYGVRIAYADAQGLWRNDWRGQTRLPSAVEVVVTDAQGAPVLTVARRLGAEVPARCALSRSPTQCDAPSPQAAPAGNADADH